MLIIYVFLVGMDLLMQMTTFMEPFLRICSSRVLEARAPTGLPLESPRLDHVLQRGQALLVANLLEPNGHQVHPRRLNLLRVDAKLRNLSLNNSSGKLVDLQSQTLQYEVSIHSTRCSMVNTQSLVYDTCETRGTLPVLIMAQ